MNSETFDTPGKHGNQSVDKSNATSEKNPKSGGASGSGPLTPPPDNTKTACHCHYNSPHWGWRILEGVALVSAVAYAIITYCMWRDSHNNFLIDEQPSVYVQFAWPQVVNEQAKFFVATRTINSGKTFAKQIRTQYVLGILSNTESPLFDFSNPDSQDITGLIPPNNSYQISQVVTRADQPLGRVFKKGEVEDLMAGRRYLFVVARGQYLDQFGHWHWFHHCDWKSYYQASTYAAAGCTVFNDFGDGPLPDKDLQSQK